MSLRNIIAHLSAQRFPCAEWKFVGEGNGRRGPSRHQLSVIEHVQIWFVENGCPPKTCVGPQRLKEAAESCHTKTLCVNLLEIYARVF